MEYENPFEPIPGVTARLVEAGHILGSAAICLDINEPGREPFRFWFSGDIGRRNLALILDPQLPRDPNILMMECTYGDTRHQNDPVEAHDRFREVVKRTIKRGGKLIIPAFAVGRTQELVYALHQFIEDGDMPSVPIYVDSPLAVEASRVYQRSSSYFDQETQEFIKEEGEQPLVYEELTYISSVEASKALNDRDDPMIIISASGMAEVGRIVHHIKNNIENPRNTIAIVSWQAPGTLGRRLVEGAKQVSIFGEDFDVKAEVVEIEGLSAHAGQNMLMEYALANRDTTREIILVHGEPDAAQAFMDKWASFRGPKVVYPDLGESMEV
jgi:metallo-beta-lactamase family protein